MRKFNLRGTVVERMMGIQRKEPIPADNKDTDMHDHAEPDAGFSEDQGMFSYAWRTDVGRIRKNLAFDNGISLWCVADNLRIGAALNTVRICKKVTEMGLYRGEY